MTLNNPSKVPETIAKANATKRANGFADTMRARLGGIPLSHDHRYKVAKTISSYFRENMSDREHMMSEALIPLDGKWVSQYHFDCAVLDFARPDIRCAFEPDVGGHKLERSLNRDAALVRQGWTIFRFRCDKAASPDYFLHAISIAAQIIPNLQGTREFPPARKYGVVIRCPENPAGLRVYHPDDAALKSLALRISDRLPPAKVG